MLRIFAVLGKTTPSYHNEYRVWQSKVIVADDYDDARESAQLRDFDACELNVSKLPTLNLSELNQLLQRNKVDFFHKYSLV